MNPIYSKVVRGKAEIYRKAFVAAQNYRSVACEGNEVSTKRDTNKQTLMIVMRDKQTLAGVMGDTDKQTLVVVMGMHE